MKSAMAVAYLLVILSELSLGHRFGLQITPPFAHRTGCLQCYTSKSSSKPEP